MRLNGCFPNISPARFTGLPMFLELTGSLHGLLELPKMHIAETGFPEAFPVVLAETDFMAFPGTRNRAAPGSKTVMDAEATSPDIKYLTLVDDQGGKSCNKHSCKYRYNPDMR